MPDRMKRVIKYVLPPSLRTAMLNAFDDVADFSDRLRGKQTDLVPPRKMIHNIGGSFIGVGSAFFRHFVELGGLQPTERVLDVGCGVGRMAVPLTGYLGDGGRYNGLDIDTKEIAWCTRHITSRYPNFRFQVADIYSKRYNPKGNCKASEYRFPFADNSFDFVFLTSVFTHMLPPDLENYLSEISRVLADNGRCFMTFFLLNADSIQAIEKQESSLDFKYDYGDYRTADRNMPEWAVAFPEALVIEACERHGLRIRQPIHYGFWCRRAGSFDYQDILVASKG